MDRPGRKSPELNVTLDQRGRAPATLQPDGSQTIKKVEIYYAVRNDNPITRYWRLAPCQSQWPGMDRRAADLDPRDRLFAFANVLYESGICLSSNFQAVVPAELGPAKATDRPSLLIGDFSHGLDGFTTSSPGTDPNRFTQVMETVIGPDGITGLHMLGRPWILTL